MGDGPFYPNTGPFSPASGPFSPMVRFTPSYPNWFILGMHVLYIDMKRIDIPVNVIGALEHINHIMCEENGQFKEGNIRPKNR